MKRKLYYLVAIIFSLSFVFSACAPKDIGETKAKEIGLATINKLFGANETDAQISSEQMEYFTYRNGTAVSAGDADGTRKVYYIRVAKSESQPLYEAWVIGDSGKPLYISQNELNIILTDAQKEEANTLFAEERRWGKQHDAARAELKTACEAWATANLMVDYPVLFSAETGDYKHTTITTTFIDSYYVVMQDGTIYIITMQWPSMQVLRITMQSEE